MASKLLISEDEEVSYLPLAAAATGDGDAEGNNPDNLRLKQLGYKQELSRSLSAVANFSMAFSIVSVLTGLTTLYGTGIRFGGPVTMVYGWLIVGAMTMTVGLSMAETIHYPRGKFVHCTCADGSQGNSVGRNNRESKIRERNFTQYCIKKKKKFHPVFH